MSQRKAAFGLKYLPFLAVQLKGDSFEELLEHLCEAIAGCLSP
jgi:hypothetical protein